MSNIKTYDLIQCSRLYPTLDGVNNAAFLPYIDKFVKINSDEEQSYSVKENVQARFLAPTSADGVSDVQYKVTSILFNGLECLSTSPTLTVEESENIHIDFPLYAATPNGYTANLANAVYTETVSSSLGYFERNFIDFMQGLFDALSIDAHIVNSHPDWWAIDGEEVMNNFMIELHSSDSIDITIRETYNGTSRNLRYVVGSGAATAYIGGVDVTAIPVPADEQPQYGDEYSIYSRPLTADPIVEVECCPLVTPFQASLSNNGCSTFNIDCDCSKLTFSDTSVYDNGLIGHDPEFFNHRMIILTRPDGSTYIWSTDGEVGVAPSGCCCQAPSSSSSFVVNQIIAPHYDSSNMFSYALSDSDTDGIYNVKICTYPDWQDDVLYDVTLNNFVYRNGVIYKQVSTSTGVDPELDTDNTYWIAASADDCKGRYCSDENILVLCISINDCYKKLVEKALCDIKSNPCKNMCDNKYLMNAMKMRVTMDALEWSTCADDWVKAKEEFEILKSICCCNG